MSAETSAFKRES